MNETKEAAAVNERALADLNWLVRSNPQAATLLSGMIASRQAYAMCQAELETVVKETTKTRGEVRAPDAEVMEMLREAAAQKAEKPFDFSQTVGQLGGPVLELLRRLAQQRKNQADAEARSGLAHLDEVRKKTPVQILNGAVSRDKPVLLSGISPKQPALVLELVRSAADNGARVLFMAKRYGEGVPALPKECTVLPVEFWGRCCASKQIFADVSHNVLNPRFEGGVPPDLVVVDDFLVACPEFVQADADPVSQTLDSVSGLNDALKRLWSWCKYQGAALVAAVPVVVSPDFAELTGGHVTLWRPAASVNSASGLLELSCPVCGVPMK